MLKMFYVDGASLLAVGADAVGKGTGSTGRWRKCARVWPLSGPSHSRPRASRSFGFWVLSPGVLVLTFLGQFMGLFNRYLLTDELFGRDEALGLVGLVFSQKDRTDSDRVNDPPPLTLVALMGTRWLCDPSFLSVTSAPRTKGLVCFLCPAAGLSGLLARGLPHHLHLPFPPRWGVLPGVPR